MHNTRQSTHHSSTQLRPLLVEYVLAAKVYSSYDNSVDNEVVPATAVTDVEHYVVVAAAAAVVVITASAAV